MLTSHFWSVSVGPNEVVRLPTSKSSQIMMNRAVRHHTKEPSTLEIKFKDYNNRAIILCNQPLVILGDNTKCDLNFSLSEIDLKQAPELRATGAHYDIVGEIQSVDIDKLYFRLQDFMLGFAFGWLIVGWKLLN